MRKNKFMKGVAIATIAAMSMGMLAGCGGGKDTNEDKQYKVGVVQLVQHGALDQANQGMIAGLADNGFVEGENLIVNRLAIPHCWSEQERRFRGFFITLAHPIEVNNEIINHVLIACAAADARHELKIFSYLASVLCQHPAEVIAGLTGYEAFMELLHKG